MDTKPAFETIRAERTEPDSKALVDLAKAAWADTTLTATQRHDACGRYLALALRYDKTGADKRIARLEKRLEDEEKQRAKQSNIVRLKAVDSAP